MATRYNNRKIISTHQTLPLNKILPGMIVTFNYSEEGVTDPRPILLFLHRDTKINTVEGLNLNYINPSKIKKLFSVIEFKKGKLDEHENLIKLKRMNKSKIIGIFKSVISIIKINIIITYSKIINKKIIFF